jgi:hypothetical protein
MKWSCVYLCLLRVTSSTSHATSLVCVWTHNAWDLAMLAALCMYGHVRELEDCNTHCAWFHGAEVGVTSWCMYRLHESKLGSLQVHVLKLP